MSPDARGTSGPRRAGDLLAGPSSIAGPYDSSEPDKPLLLGRLESGGLLIADGAMGTELQKAGLPPGACPEAWNLERPDAVMAVSRAYAEAGAEILTTNTFGGGWERLAARGQQSSLEAINAAGARIARIAGGGHVLVAGSIGPTGRILEPAGDLNPRVAFEGFRRQADALAAGGCDALIVETMTDLREALLAVEAAAATGLPVVACLTFETTPRGVYTIFGDTPARAAIDLESAGARVIGANCGSGPGPMIEMIRALRSVSRLPLIAQPNAGLPEMAGGRIIYPEAPESMALHAARLVEAGASIVGGCCGTTPEHTRALAVEIGKPRGSARDRPGE